MMLEELAPVLVAIVGMLGVVSVPAISGWMTSKNEIAAAQLVGKREAYEAFLDFVHSVSRRKPQEEHRTAFKKALAMWGSPDSVRAWMEATEEANKEDMDPEVVFGKVLAALRRDIGHQDGDMPAKVLSELLMVAPAERSP